MTPEEQNLRKGLAVYRETVEELAKVQSKLKAVNRLLNHFYHNYHKTRVALIESRLDKRELETIVAKFKNPLGGNGLNLELDNDKGPTV